MHAVNLKVTTLSASTRKSRKHHRADRITIRTEIPNQNVRLRMLHAIEYMKNADKSRVCEACVYT